MSDDHPRHRVHGARVLLGTNRDAPSLAAARAVEQSEARLSVDALIEKAALKASERRLLIAHALGATWKAVAREHGISEGVARTRGWRALEKLRAAV